MICPIRWGIKCNGHKQDTVTLGGGNKAASACPCKARFDPYGTVKRAQQSVVVYKKTRGIRAVLGCGLALGRNDLGKAVVLKGCSGEACQITRGGVMLIVMQTVRIGEMGIGQPECACALVHHIRKALNATAQRISNGGRGIICAL